MLQAWLISDVSGGLQIKFQYSNTNRVNIHMNVNKYEL